LFELPPLSVYNTRIMLFKTVPVGELQTNCYIVYDPSTKDAVVIDPGAESAKILKVLGDEGLKADNIIITHGHYDHFSEANIVSEKTGAKILIHEDDSQILGSRILTLRGLMFPITRVDHKLKDGEVIKFGGQELKVIHTPGHSRGGVCFYSQKDSLMFSGDTLFKNDHGRTDLPGSSEDQMERSLKRLMELPDDVKVYPGHGASTTIGDERRNLAE